MTAFPDLNIRDFGCNSFVNRAEGLVERTEREMKMSNKTITIKISEQDVLNTFVKMCEESVNPDLYSCLVDEIVPALKLVRKDLNATRTEPIYELICNALNNLKTAKRLCPSLESANGLMTLQLIDIVERLLESAKETRAKEANEAEVADDPD